MFNSNLIQRYAVSHAKMSYLAWLSHPVIKKATLALFLDYLRRRTSRHPAWDGVTPEMDYRRRYNKIRPWLEELKSLAIQYDVEEEMLCE